MVKVNELSHNKLPHLDKDVLKLSEEAEIVTEAVSYVFKCKL